MRTLVSISCFVLFACQPDERCSGDLEYDGRSCVRAEKPKPDAGADDEDAGSGEPDCATYCRFANECIGQNSLAMAGLSDVIDALDADDPAACAAACNSDSEASDEEVLACFHAGRREAACEEGSQPALERAIGLIGECCGGEDAPLCRSICAALTANATVASRIDFCD